MRPNFALSYYIGMFLILLCLLISLIRHLDDVRLVEVILLIALGATILFAIFAAWRATSMASEPAQLGSRSCAPAKGLLVWQIQSLKARLDDVILSFGMSHRCQGLVSRS